MTGTTNSAAKKTVTVIESSDPRYGEQNLTVPLPDDSAASSGYMGDLDSEVVWASWLGDSELWNLGFEHFDNLNQLGNLNELDNIYEFDKLNEFGNLDNLGNFYRSDYPV